MDIRIIFDGGWDDDGTARDAVHFGNMGSCERLICFGRVAGCHCYYAGQLSLSQKPVSIEIDDEGKIFVIDPGTTNGVYINGARIPAAEPVEFRLGTDRLHISQFLLNVRQPDEEGQAWTACLKIKPTTEEERRAGQLRRLSRSLSQGTIDPYR